MPFTSPDNNQDEGCYPVASFKGYEKTIPVKNATRLPSLNL
jgi:hypothetical protein